VGSISAHYTGFCLWGLDQGTDMSMGQNLHSVGTQWTVQLLILRCALDQCQAGSSNDGPV